MCEELSFLMVLQKSRQAGMSFTFMLTLRLRWLSRPLRTGREEKFISLTSCQKRSPEHKDIQTIEWKEVYYLRGEMLPMVRVNNFFRIEGDSSDRSFAVLVGFGERRVGLMVDELFGQHEIVIKSLGSTEKMRGFLHGIGSIRSSWDRCRISHR
jgi:two-component system chemotaxis sensor kinase CheA